MSTDPIYRILADLADAVRLLERAVHNPSALDRARLIVKRARLELWDLAKQQEAAEQQRSMVEFEMHVTREDG